MGYACPVCGDPQADAEHLANHLAFTALLGDDAHEAWLDEHAPEWDQADADSLATTVTDHADEVEFPQVFEDTTTEHSHAEHDDHPSTVAGGHETRHRELDAQGEQVLEDARELTRRMHENATEGDDVAAGAATDADDAADATDDADEAETE